ncbi:trna dimethylallyltransferase [Lucifera butyrica]|uniref:tRNA dimethylallyltransferase n=1 Tax=Lucifera butyrica TaxID=1351585 RepID=A0A498R3K9_9FIRM|nr:tRNA (adenosine(37)-N6)-dimethylallyltransferase MiaA [Lucifera butyrica]VBB05994.1 trna dimethylallyltransferase [Lucifera butyrica]
MEQLIAILGPTAVGKTKLSIDLARLLNTEIISGDSMLVYREMNIGTAKPSPEERSGIVHHLIDIREPGELFNVVDFRQLAVQCITAIQQKGKIPILAGGTGLYVKALLEGYQFNQSAGDESLRKKYTALAEQHGKEYVYSLLVKLAPESARRVHPNDLRRIIRALEVYHLEGNTVSERKFSDQQTLMYDVLAIGLTLRRELLYERINNRVDQMFANGLVDEVRLLLSQGVLPAAQSMQGIGYKEVCDYLAGTASLNETMDNIKQATRRFAKRQLTWYRKMPYIHWIDIDNFGSYDKMFTYIYSLIAGKF